MSGTVPGLADGLSHQIERSSSSISSGVAGRGFAWLPARAAAAAATSAELVLGNAEVAEPLEAAEPRELARALDGVAADRLAEARDRLRARARG